MPARQWSQIDMCNYEVLIGTPMSKLDFWTLVHTDPLFWSIPDLFLGPCLSKFCFKSFWIWNLDFRSSLNRFELWNHWVSQLFWAFASTSIHPTHQIRCEEVGQSFGGNTWRPPKGRAPHHGEGTHRWTGPLKWWYQACSCLVGFNHQPSANRTDKNQSIISIAPTCPFRHGVFVFNRVFLLTCCRLYG